ncbi:MafI family immunity protein [Shewanella intestini]|uniref:MafI family immunity protein n=1 Tax=Shewanella intestini TaxID=2017544 RepID=A0ABS5I7D7_9GAMM|nr:MafI family immunity protein [Shewanella sp. XMDDZSB0408]MBR9729644.1 MafI family immunity protein [Shewanella intestini]
MKNIDEQIRNLLASATCGLSDFDVKNASEFIDHNEFGVAFELICDQLYENESQISSELIADISRIAKLMQLEDNSWSFLKENVG